eukprot:2643855-Rhodomonas_salina.2
MSGGEVGDRIREGAYPFCNFSSSLARFSLSALLFMYAACETPRVTPCPQPSTRTAVLRV